MFRKTCVQLCVLALLALPSYAQEADTVQTPAATTTNEELVTRIFRIENADIRDLANVIMIFGGRVQPEPDLGVIGWTGPASMLPAVEAAIANLDVAPVPEPNVELTVYFLMAAREGGGTSGVPAALDGVAVQLKEVFGYDSVQLIETTAIRVRPGSGGKLNGFLPQRRGDSIEARYEFYFRELKVTEDENGRSIRLDELRATIQTPRVVVENGEPTNRWVETGIRTDVDLREGQKAVVGKTTTEGGAEAIFVVVDGAIVE